MLFIEDLKNLGGELVWREVGGKGEGSEVI